MAGENVPKSTHAYFFDPQMEDYNHLKHLLIKGEKNMAKSCIEKGFPLNKDYADKTYDGTPLHLAVSQEYPDIVELLLEKGACINSRNDNNETPLMLAAIIGNRQITDIFLRKLQPYNYRNDHRFSYFHIACMQNNVDLVQQFLIFGGELNERVNKKSFFWPGFTPLHFAIEFRSIETAKLLIEKGADITIQDRRGLTPLHLAFRKRNRVLTDLLLSKQYYFASNPVDPHGLSHFHISCAFNKKGIIEDFLDKKINLRSILPRDALFNGRGCCNGFQFAIRNQCIDVLECLLTCDAFAVERDQSTVIDYAYERKNQNILNLIISYVEKGIISIYSTPSIENLICKEIPKLGLVLESIYTSDIFEHLKRFNVSQYSELHVAVLQKDQDQVNSIHVQHLPSIILVKDARGKTPLHLAIETKQTNLLDQLLPLHLHLDENPVDSDNLSHFHISCAMNNSIVVDEFIKKGVEVNMKINMNSPIWPGFTPLHIAVLHRHLKLMKSLLDNGADFTLKNALGQSPYELAISVNLRLFLGNDVDDYEDWDVVEPILLANERRKADNFYDYGITLLHVASVKNNVAMIQRYATPGTINKTTDENLPHKNGCTASCTWLRITRAKML